MLLEYKYSPRRSATKRRARLARLVTSGQLKASTVYKYLLSLSKFYSKRSSYVSILRGDARWIREKYYGTRYW